MLLSIVLQVVFKDRTTGRCYSLDFAGYDHAGVDQCGSETKSLVELAALECSGGRRNQRCGGGDGYGVASFVQVRRVVSKAYRQQ